MPVQRPATPSERRGSAPSHSGTALDHDDLNKILDLLVDCEGSASLEEFRRAVTEALGRHFGYRNATFFVARGFRHVTTDKDPVVTGRALRMVPPYLEDYQPIDPFAQPKVWLRLQTLRPLSLDEFNRPAHTHHRRYLDTFLFRNRIHSKIVIPLVPGDIQTGSA